MNKKIKNKTRKNKTRKNKTRKNKTRKNKTRKNKCASRSTRRNRIVRKNKDKCSTKRKNGGADFTNYAPGFPRPRTTPLPPPVQVNVVSDSERTSDSGHTTGEASDSDGERHVVSDQ